MSDQEVVSDDTSNTNVESEVDENKELLEKSTAKELFDMGKLEFRENEEYEIAAERFSMALEKRTKELNVEGSIHPELREYYLFFADVLLTKEEHKNDLFEFLKTKRIVDHAQSEKSVESEEVTDEQLAFEMFEFARKCYEKHLEDLEKAKETVPVTEVINFSYVFIRLGDINLLNHFFPEALEEYKKCVELREKYNLGNENLIAPLISLSQSYMFCGKRKDAVEHFERVEQILLDVRQKTIPLPDGTNEKIIRDTYEDVRIQINDLKRQIEEEGEEGQELGSQTNAKELVITTKSEFDKAMLNKENNEVTKIKVSRVAEDDETHAAKKRRIDLSKFKN